MATEVGTTGTVAGPLSGTLVIEMSEIFQAPLAAQTLGDLGADVIKVERPGGDIMRRLDLVANARDGMSSYFAATNRNKLSICLDLKTDDGKRELSKLLAQADVFIHNYRPGVLEKLGFGYEDVRTRNPRLIYAWATAYGESGPLSSAPGQDIVLQSLSGMAMGSAGADGQPTFSNTPSVDFASGMLLAQGVMAALIARSKSGQGQRVRVSLLDTAVAMQSLAAASELMYGYETNWFTSNLNFVFQTKAGWLTVLGFFRDNPLALMCRAVGIENLTERHEFATLEDQLARRDEIARLLGEPVSRMSRDEALARFTAVDVLCAPALSLAEALGHAQVQHNGMVCAMPVPGGSTVQATAYPVHLSATPGTIRRGPPALDENRTEIHNRWLQRKPADQQEETA